MKAKLLTAKISGGSSIMVMELGGIMLKDGQSVLVEDKIADRIAKKYRMELGDEREVSRLGSGHYEIVRDAQSPATKVVKKKEIKEEPEVKEKELEDVAKDKSAKSLFGSKKVRKK